MSQIFHCLKRFSIPGLRHDRRTDLKDDRDNIRSLEEGYLQLLKMASAVPDDDQPSYYGGMPGAVFGRCGGEATGDRGSNHEIFIPSF